MCRSMENDPTAPSSSQHTRRDLIKKSAVAGAAIWAAPAILSVSRVAAASVVTPPGPGPCTTCNASAFGILVTGTVASAPLVPIGPLPTTSGGLVCDTSVVPGVVTTDVMCVQTFNDNDSCRATAIVNGLDILGGLVESGVIQSAASWACDCDPLTRTSSVAGLSVGGNPVVGINGTPNQTLATINVNLGILLNAAVVITANQQSCVGGVASVNALVITITVSSGLVPVVVTNITVTIAHSQVANGCPCV